MELHTATFVEDTAREWPVELQLPFLKVIHKTTL